MKKPQLKISRIFIGNESLKDILMEYLIQIAPQPKKHN